MKKLLIWSRVPYYNHCPCRSCYHRAKKYHPKRFPLPTLYLRQNLICPPAGRLYLKELLNILQTVSSCSRYITFFLFESLFHRQSLPIPKPSPLRFTHYADVSENTLPFVSQSRNIFSDYDLSQTHDWERPSLSPHVLLLYSIPDNVRQIEKKSKRKGLWFTLGIVSGTRLEVRRNALTNRKDLSAAKNCYPLHWNWTVDFELS